MSFSVWDCTFTSHSNVEPLFEVLAEPLNGTIQEKILDYTMPILVKAAVSPSETTDRHKPLSII